MTRQATSLKTARRYARRAGVPEETIKGALVRGGTDHRIDLITTDNRIISYWPKEAAQRVRKLIDDLD